MTKHTPGPWVAEGETVWSESLDRKAWGWVAECSRSVPEAEVNARLVAAAPEMLEALKAVEWSGWHDDRYYVCPACGARAKKRGAKHRDVCPIGNAIAKAEGK